jgi:hypothetical protein
VVVVADLPGVPDKGDIMPNSSSTQPACLICGSKSFEAAEDDSGLCPACLDHAEDLFEKELRRVELMRTIRGRDVELYDIRHPDSDSDKQHCGQLILIEAAQGFEVKICLRSDALDWQAKLFDDATGFASTDSRLDALIGNVSLLIESWGGGPYYIDIFYVEKVISGEGEI